MPPTVESAAPRAAAAPLAAAAASPTAAPWRATPFSSIVGCGVVGARGLVIATVPGDKEHAEANARLIAAAPELSRAARAAIDDLGIIVNELHNLRLNGGDVHDATPGDFRALAAEITRILEPTRAAIAKAEGRS